MQTVKCATFSLTISGMALFVITAACLLSHCKSFNGSCVPSTAGELCAECDWQGWVDETGRCIIPDPTPIVPCAPGKCVDGTGNCVDSVYGVRCRGCSYLGHVAGGDQGGDPHCVCYNGRADPWNRCRMAPKTVVTVEAISTQVDSAYCMPFQSRLLGFFGGGTGIEAYGSREYPYTPRECCSGVYGPPPGQLVEVDPSIPFQECNTIGTFDPDEVTAVSAFRTCSGHGTWDREAYSCACSPRWNADPIGVECLNSTAAVYSCRRCFGFWGPDPPISAPLDEVPMLHCSVPFVPDEHGELAECAGHGKWKDAVGCICDYDSTLGYWTTQEISHKFLRLLGNGTEREEWHTVSVCSVPVAVVANTPTQVRPYTQTPTLSGCTGCNYFGEVVMDAADYLTVTSVSVTLTPGCCTMHTADVRVEDTRVYVTAGACTVTPLMMSMVGSRWCEELVGCVAYTWSRMADGGVYMYRFTARQDYSLVLSAGSGSGLPCPLTQAPVSEPTSFPTRYPVVAPA